MMTIGQEKDVLMCLYEAAYYKKSCELHYEGGRGNDVFLAAIHECYFAWDGTIGGILETAEIFCLEEGEAKMHRFHTLARKVEYLGSEAAKKREKNFSVFTEGQKAIDAIYEEIEANEE